MPRKSAPHGHERWMSGRLDRTGAKNNHYIGCVKSGIATA
jgi:hypothetical protein